MTSPLGASVAGTYRSFFDELLETLDITPSAGAEAGLADVVHEEGANSYNNPFNIEWKPGMSSAWEGAGNFNSVGVQEYATPQAGITATAAFLEDNPRYQNLLAALKTGNTPTIQQALTAEYTWAPFHTATTAQEQAILDQATGVAPSATGTGAVASGVATGQDASIINDLWGFGSAGDAATATIGALVLESLFVLAGLGIVGIGVYRASAPVRHRVTAAAKDIAPLAAAA